MKTLVVEDDFTSRVLLQEILKQYGVVHVAVNGKEAVQAVQSGRESGDPYDLVCLDIRMPEMDGHEALKKIRGFEEMNGINSPHGVRIIMTTGLDNMQNVFEAFRGLCDAYLVKPIEKAKLVEQLHKFHLAA